MHQIKNMWLYELKIFLVLIHTCIHVSVHKELDLINTDVIQNGALVKIIKKLLKSIYFQHDFNFTFLLPAFNEISHSKLAAKPKKLGINRTEL